MTIDQDPNSPVILSDGNLVTDGGFIVSVQYVDIGLDKLEKRPRVLLKAIESRYGLEHSPTIRISAPRRFREFGETFIKDTQEGRAHREQRQESTSRSGEERSREQERALSLLGQHSVMINKKSTTNSHTDSESMTFGKSSWIYCMSLPPSDDERIQWRKHLSCEYDHVSTIRQPTKFAQALGLMFADQAGAQGQNITLTHNKWVKSKHDSQMIFHGPVWYTDDVLGFLKAHESEPLYYLYPLFIKDTKYRPQREYRFVVHCETTVEQSHLDLSITGMMRDTLAPICMDSSVQFEKVTDSEASNASFEITGPTRKTDTTTRKKRSSMNRKSTVKVDGAVVREETFSGEELVTLTTENTHDDYEERQGVQDAGSSHSVNVVNTEIRNVEVEGVVVDSGRFVRTRIAYINTDSSAEEFFTLVDRNQVEHLFKIISEPFQDFPNLPPTTSTALIGLAKQTCNLEPESEIVIMSACWNSIWALCNLYKCLGDIVDSVSIEQSEFVAIVIRKSDQSQVEGKLLIGPRGTYAFVLRSDGKEYYDYGGEETRLWVFPDEGAVNAFREFGWEPDV